MKKLHIVVPYRNRQQHLTSFQAHVSTYFARDKLDSRIPYRVTVVEQADGLPFNRGALLNAGFLLGGDCDYTCFHDVDYLPIWADYSYCETPACILWFGLEKRPIRVDDPSTCIAMDIENVFGGVVLIDNAQFRQAGGFSNSYWGWGYEDLDFKMRLQAEGFPLQRRKGTFQPLDHDNEGFRPDMTPSPIGLVNRTILQSRMRPGGLVREDGLSDLSFQIVERRELAYAHREHPASWELVSVRLTMAPGQDQLAALSDARSEARSDALYA